MGAKSCATATLIKGLRYAGTAVDMMLDAKVLVAAVTVEGHSGRSSSCLSLASKNWTFLITSSDAPSKVRGITSSKIACTDAIEALFVSTIFRCSGSWHQRK